MRSHAGNSFDLIRVAAALAVLYSHSFALYGLPEPKIMGDTLGTLAVAVFFAVSGFLVCQSWERDPRALRFTVRRALRIVPGLLVAVFFTAFVAGAIDTTLPLGDYLTAAGTWSYFVNNALLLAGVTTLPGAFRDLPHVDANGSLWTLHYEVLMYAALVVFGLTRRLRALCAVAFVVCGVAWVAMTALQTKSFGLPIPLIWKVGLEFNNYAVARLGAFFFGASLLYLHRRALPLSVPAAAALLLAALPAPPGWPTVALLVAAVPYATIVLAYRLPPAIGNLRGWDPSYGIYVYAFPVQQLVSRYCLDRQYGWAASLAVSTAVTLLLAGLSWKYLERPALGLIPACLQRLGTVAAWPAVVAARWRKT